MFNERQKIREILTLRTEIAHVQDIDLLLKKILTTARKLVNADAGTIYLKDENTLIFSHAQNDTLQKHLTAGQKLIYQTFTMPITHHSIAGYIANTGGMLNLANVHRISTLAPYAFDGSYDQKTSYHTKSMLTFALKDRQGEIFGVIQLINAQNEQGEIVPFSLDDAHLVQMLANNTIMAIEKAQKTRTEIIRMIRLITEVHDPEETEAHVNRVGAYATEIFEVWAHNKGIIRTKIERSAELLRMAAMLHDMGKLAIPSNIREKPGKFTDEEFEIMKQHTIKGAQMLYKSAQMEYREAAAQIALTHHERWDGNGYPGHVYIETGQPVPGYQGLNGKPRGKKGEEIPVFGRVVAIADVYDALSCRRAFRKAFQEEEVLEILKKGSGTQFDPELIDAFFACYETIRTIAQRYPEE